MANWIVNITLKIPEAFTSKTIWHFETTWRQYAVTLMKSYDFPHFPKAFVFHEYECGSNLVREHVCVRGGCQPFSSQRNDVQACRKLVEKTRVAC